MTSGQAHRFSTFRADLHGPEAAEEWRGNWAAALLFRRPAIHLAWSAYRMGIAPISITYLALAVAVSLPLHALLWPLAVAPWILAISGALFQVLDCTDGTLARATQQTSKRGADLDFLIDMAQWFLLYIALGLLADRLLETGFAWTALAAVAAWSRLMARIVRDRLGTGNDKVVPKLQKNALDYASIFLGGISALIPFFAFLGPSLPWAIWFLLIYALLDIAEGALPLIRR